MKYKYLILSLLFGTIILVCRVVSTDVLCRITDWMGYFFIMPFITYLLLAFSNSYNIKRKIFPIAAGCLLSILLVRSDWNILMLLKIISFMAGAIIMFLSLKKIELKQSI